ncbi:MAG: hypothetical protein JW904_06090 [Spirochaetales bacterium]|nr:hypothetical protein [Spirochaetales bacterium]
MNRIIIFINILLLMSTVSCRFVPDNGSHGDLIPIKVPDYHYVRADATGSNTGTDWENALPALPDELIRGDVYYIADGTYGYYTFDDPEFGKNYITIRKATQDEHGTHKGWDNSFGDGQAHFTGDPLGIYQPIIGFRRSYYIFDGVTGFGGMDNESSYGFKLTHTNHLRNNTSLGIPEVGHATRTLTHIEVRHTAMINAGYAAANNGVYGQFCVYSNSNPGNEPEHLIIADNLLTNSSSNMLIRRWRNCIIENNFFDLNWSSTDNHGQQISPGNGCEDIILRNNIFRDSYIFVIGTHRDFNRRWKIYNNVVIGGNVSGVWANAESAYPDVVINWEVHHNTHVNVTIGGLGAVFSGILSHPVKYQSYAYNNVFYNCSHPRFDTVSYVIHSHNAYFSCSGIFTVGLKEQQDDIDPFMDSVNNDYHLRFPTYPGKKYLDELYETDRDGVNRRHDGYVAMGAYEFVD